MTNLNIYSKEQIDAILPTSSQLVPSTSGASLGDVLTYDGSDISWAPSSGGSTFTEHTFSTAGNLAQALIDHPYAIVRGAIETTSPTSISAGSRDVYCINFYIIDSSNVAFQLITYHWAVENSSDTETNKYLQIIYYGGSDLATWNPLTVNVNSTSTSLSAQGGVRISAGRNTITGATLVSGGIDVSKIKVYY